MTFTGITQCKTRIKIIYKEFLFEEGTLALGRTLDSKAQLYVQWLHSHPQLNIRSAMNNFGQACSLCMSRLIAMLLLCI